MQKHLKLLALEVGALRLYDLTSQTVNILLEVRDNEMLYIITKPSHYEKYVFTIFVLLC